MTEACAIGLAKPPPTWEQRSNWPPRTRHGDAPFQFRRDSRGGVGRITRNGMPSRPLSSAARAPQSEDAMAPSNYLPKLRIALLVGAALMPALSLAQSVQAPPLPKAPPEIMSNETRDPKACAQQGLTVGQDNKPQSAETTGKALSEQLARSDGVICPPTGVDPEIRAPTPQGGSMPVIPPPGSPGGDPNIRPK
jgi:hypothetical protein